jgi:hypothetical protein
VDNITCPILSAFDSDARLARYGAFSHIELITNLGDRLSSSPFIHDLHTSQFPLTIPMSGSSQTARPLTDNFTAIFNAAITEYQTLTGEPLDTHPFATQLDTCQNPEDVSDLFRTQARAFSKFCKGDEKLMAWLDPTIHILLTFSDTLGEGICLVSKPRSFAHDYFWMSISQPFAPAKTIFTGIGVLLTVCIPASPLSRFSMISIY